MSRLQSRLPIRSLMGYHPGVESRAWLQGRDAGAGNKGVPAPGAVSLEINRMPPLHDRSQTARVASTEEIRAAFPALERRHGGVAVAYLDGPGGTQVPRVVVEAMADYLLHHNANTHWAFP